MAFKAHNLSVLSYANGFTLWHYITDDDAEAVTSSGYFNAAREMLSPGNMVMANCADASMLVLISPREVGGTVETATLPAAGNLPEKPTARFSDLLADLHRRYDGPIPEHERDAALGVRSTPAESIVNELRALQDRVYTTMCSLPNGVKYEALLAQWLWYEEQIWDFIMEAGA